MRRESLRLVSWLCALGAAGWISLPAVARAAAPEPVTAELDAQVSANPLDELDSLAWSGRIALIQQALDGYRALHRDTEGTVAWRIGRTYFNLYDETPPSDKETKKRFALESEKWARTGRELAPDSVEANYWFAMSLLAVSDVKGALTFLGEMGEIKRVMYWVLERDPKIDDAGPDRFLGLFLYEAPWPIGSASEAYTHLRRAIELAPYRCANRDLAARIHLEREEFAEAEKHIAILETDTCTATSELWHGIYREHGKELRQRLDKERQ